MKFFFKKRPKLLERVEAHFLRPQLLSIVLLLSGISSSIQAEDGELPSFEELTCQAKDEEFIQAYQQFPNFGGLTNPAKEGEFIQATQQIPNFGGLTYWKGKLLVCGYPKNVRVFDPDIGQFTSDAFVLPQQNFSFPNDVAVIPADTSRGIVGGFVCTSFLDGRIYTVLNNGTIILSNTGPFPVFPQTGPVNVFTASADPTTLNPILQLCQPIAYRKSNDRIYTQTAFAPNVLYSLDWRGSVPTPIMLSDNVGMGFCQFGSDDKLYAPDTPNDRIVKIDPNTGTVTPFLSGITKPIALKIDEKGVFYIASRQTGMIYRFNPFTDQLTTLAVLKPAVTDIALNSDGSILYVTNDQSRIYAVNTHTGGYEIIFDSPIVGPWDLAFDDSTNSLYVADNGSIKQFNSETGQLRRKYVIDSNPKTFGFGLACGIDVESDDDPDAKIVISDVTLGAVAGLRKRDFAVVDLFNPLTDPINGPFLLGIQPFSAVSVRSSTDYYLVTDAVNGRIIQLFPIATGLPPQIFFSGLNTPVKLKIHNGYVYVVEAGQVLLEIPNTGQISRIPLNNPTPANQQVLVKNLYQPEGLDIYDNQMLILESGNNRILQASAVGPSTPIVVQQNLQLRDDNLIYQYAPCKIHRFNGLATNPNGTRIYSNETLPDAIRLTQRLPKSIRAVK